MNNDWTLRDDATQDPTPEQRFRAVRSAAHHARDARELSELLDMLGLTPEEGLERENAVASQSAK